MRQLWGGKKTSLASLNVIWTKENSSKTYVPRKHSSTLADPRLCAFRVSFSLLGKTSELGDTPEGKIFQDMSQDSKSGQDTVKIQQIA